MKINGEETSLMALLAVQAPRLHRVSTAERGAYNLLMPLGWLMHRRDVRKVKISC